MTHVTDELELARAIVAAANSILDRGYGKPPQHIDATVDFLDRLTDADRRCLEAALDALPVGPLTIEGRAETAESGG